MGYNRDRFVIGSIISLEGSNEEIFYKGSEKGISTTFYIITMEFFAGIRF